MITEELINDLLLRSFLCADRYVQVFEKVILPNLYDYMLNINNRMKQLNCSTFAKTRPRSTHIKTNSAFVRAIGGSNKVFGLIFDNDCCGNSVKGRKEVLISLIGDFLRISNSRGLKARTFVGDLLRVSNCRSFEIRTFVGNLLRVSNGRSFEIRTFVRNLLRISNGRGLKVRTFVLNRIVNNEKALENDDRCSYLEVARYT